jgi:hypothetical protein
MDLLIALVTLATIYVVIWIERPMPPGRPPFAFGTRPAVGRVVRATVAQSSKRNGPPAYPLAPRVHNYVFANSARKRGRCCRTTDAPCE